MLGAVEAKARASYRSRAQAALHMLNNAQFLVRAAEGKELRAVGDAWLEAHKVGWRRTPLLVRLLHAALQACSELRAVQKHLAEGHT